MGILIREMLNFALKEKKNNSSAVVASQSNIQLSPKHVFQCRLVLQQLLRACAHPIDLSFRSTPGSDSLSRTAPTQNMVAKSDDIP